MIILFAKVIPEPLLKDWQERLATDDSQHWRQRWDEPQGTGLHAFPACFTSVPLKVFWGTQETDMRLVGGLMGVTQEEETLTVEPECGWAVVYEEQINPPWPHDKDGGSYGVSAPSKTA